MNNMKKDSEYQNTNYRIVGKVGPDSLFTVLPKSLTGNLQIRKGDLLKIHQESDKIIIEKVGAQT